MRHSPTSTTGIAMLAVVLAGCGAMPMSRSHEPAAPSVDRSSTETAVISSYLDVCLKVARGTPAEQAEILASASNDYSAAPTPSRVLRYAMVLSTPGHAGYDPVVAQRLLHEVLANPETLLPAERALAFLQLQQVERQQSQQADVRRLQQSADRATNDRIAQLTKRLTTESDENARLKKALADAAANRRTEAVEVSDASRHATRHPAYPEAQGAHPGRR